MTIESMDQSNNNSSTNNSIDTVQDTIAHLLRFIDKECHECSNNKNEPRSTLKHHPVQVIPVPYLVSLEHINHTIVSQAHTALVPIA